MRHDSVRNWWAASVAILCICPSVRGQLNVLPSEPSGIYAPGSTVGWTLTQAVSSPSANYKYILLQNGVTLLKQGPLDFVDGKAGIEAFIDHPGALLLEVRRSTPLTNPTTARSSDNRILSGALVDPKSIQPTLARPVDFDQWWSKKIEELQAVPINPVLEKGSAGRATVDYFKIKFDTIRGKTIQGQLAKPAIGEKFPAVLILQWAGIYPLQKSWVIDRASHGWLALNIEPHDIEIDREPAYYKQLTAGDLKDYYHAGDNDREKSYFLRMYLSAFRAASYLASRPDWDGKTFVVMGTSMGGQQSFAIAGLCEKVTAMMVLVPSSCDEAGPTNPVPRAAGFPDWAAQARQKNDPAIIETGRYFDPVNFASRIKCPALVSMGLYDETSPPVGVYAAFNQLQGKKEAMPLYSGHQEARGSQRPYNNRAQQWLTALSDGSQVPPE